MNKNFYPIKHWFLSLVIGPLFPLIITNKSLFGLSEVYFFFISFSIIYSIPAFIFYYILFLQLLKVNLSSIAKKIILNSFGIIGLIITLLLRFGTINDSFLFDILIGYSSAIIISSFFYKIETKNKFFNFEKNIAT